jgi:hypothetical protein
MKKDSKKQKTNENKITRTNGCTCPPGGAKGMDEMCPVCLEKYESELMENQDELIKAGLLRLPENKD